MLNNNRTAWAAGYAAAQADLFARDVAHNSAVREGAMQYSMPATTSNPYLAARPLTEFLDGKLSLVEAKPGEFWLYDETRGMNLSMRTPTAEAAFVEALGYYQSRLLRAENEYKLLKQKVDDFVGQFGEDE